VNEGALVRRSVTGRGLEIGRRLRRNREICDGSHTFWYEAAGIERREFKIKHLL
jgi:hypothetical protein